MPLFHVGPITRIMSILIVIPARLASTRLPNKPLADIGGLPMVVRVANAAQKAGLGDTIIAAADAEIVQVTKAHGLDVVLTDPNLPSGSDRARAAAKLIDPDGNANIVVNVQGDMPELAPEHVQLVVNALNTDPLADMATLAFKSHKEIDLDDTNVVKVLMKDGLNHGLLEAVSFVRRLPDAQEKTFWHHIGIYAYRRAALERFCNLPPSPKEQAEKLEQWRALEAGMKIICAVTQKDCPGIDSPEDLARIRCRYDKRPNP